MSRFLKFVGILNLVCFYYNSIWYIYIHVHLSLLLRLAYNDKLELFLSNIVPGTRLVVDHNSMDGLFQNLLGMKSTAILHIKHGEFSLEYTFNSNLHYYALSPFCFNIPAGIEYSPVKINSYNYTSSTQILLLNDVYNYLNKSGFGYFKNTKLKFIKEKYNNYELVHCDISGIGMIIMTEYFKMTSQLFKSIVESINKLAITMGNPYSWRGKTSLWTTTLIDNLLNILINAKIIKIPEINLEVVPEMVPILIPFAMVDRWAVHPEIVRIGIDFRKIEGSGLEEYFNMEKIKEMCGAGGVYIRTYTITTAANK